MSITKGMFTSTTDLWETPQAFFDQLNAEFCFSLDRCCMVQSSLWTEDREMGRKSGCQRFRRCHGCDAAASQDGHAVVSPVHLSPGRDPVCARPTKI